MVSCASGACRAGFRGARGDFAGACLVRSGADPGGADPSGLGRHPPVPLAEPGRGAGPAGPDPARTPDYRPAGYAGSWRDRRRLCPGLAGACGADGGPRIAGPPGRARSEIVAARPIRLALSGADRVRDGRAVRFDLARQHGWRAGRDARRCGAGVGSVLGGLDPATGLYRQTEPLSERHHRRGAERARGQPRDRAAVRRRWRSDPGRNRFRPGRRSERGRLGVGAGAGFRRHPLGQDHHQRRGRARVGGDRHPRCAAGRGLCRCPRPRGRWPHDPAIQRLG